jgi:hypothetical protein
MSLAVLEQASSDCPDLIRQRVVAVVFVELSFAAEGPSKLAAH